jgi:hypothetical protein
MYIDGLCFWACAGACASARTNENFVFVQLEFGDPKSSCETFWILTFSDAFVIGKLMPAALLRARASHIAAYLDTFTVDK